LVHGPPARQWVRLTRFLQVRNIPTGLFHPVIGDHNRKKCRKRSWISGALTLKCPENFFILGHVGFDHEAEGR
jgi:hypothetical protein